MATAQEIALNSELSRAIERHAAANEAWSKAADDDAAAIACDAACEAREALAIAPCTTPEELLEKLKALLPIERDLNGAPNVDKPFGSLALAIQRYC